MTDIDTAEADGKTDYAALTKRLAAAERVGARGLKESAQGHYRDMIVKMADDGPDSVDDESLVAICQAAGVEPKRIKVDLQVFERRRELAKQLEGAADAEAELHHAKAARDEALAGIAKARAELDAEEKAANEITAEAEAAVEALASVNRQWEDRLLPDEKRRLRAARAKSPEALAEVSAELLAV